MRTLKRGELLRLGIFLFAIAGCDVGQIIVDNGPSSPDPTGECRVGDIGGCPPGSTCVGDEEGELGYCSNNPPPERDLSPSIEPSALVFNSEGGEETVHISTGTDWSLSCTGCEDWCIVSPTSGEGAGTVTVLVSKNESDTERQAIITITTDGVELTLPVTQPGFTPEIIGFSPDEAGFGTTLTLSGTFNSTAQNNIVKINNVEVEVLSGNATELSVVVPRNKECSGYIVVDTGSKTATSTTEFSYVLTPIVSTVSGSTAGFRDALTRTDAQFSSPSGIAVDAEGNLYVADRGNHRIRKLATDGVVSTIAGNGTADFQDGTDAQFSSPSGIAIDAEGNLYVADAGNHRIRKVATNGVVSTIAGDGTAGSLNGEGNVARFSSPSDIVIDSEDSLYVADPGNNRIRKIATDGTVSTFAGTGGLGSADGPGNTATFNQPNGIGIDAEDNLYVADTYSSRIRKVAPDRVVSYISGSASGFADGPAAAALFSSPRGITTDAEGNLYVADTGNHRIRKLTPAGEVSSIAGSTFGNDDGLATTEARFNEPYGIAVDAEGNLYVADTTNHRIRMISWE